MPSRSGPSPGSPPPRLCRCGHFPTAHMVVVADSGVGAGGFHLSPQGPCQVCGEKLCGAFSPAPLVPAEPVQTT